MNQAIKELWVEQLPNYKRGRFVMRSSNDEFCPLGVLCNLHKYRAFPLISGDDWHSVVKGGGSGYTYLGQQTILPLEVVRWAELEDNAVLSNSGCYVSLGGYYLTQLNDLGVSIPEIAALITKYL